MLVRINLKNSSDTWRYIILSFLPCKMNTGISPTSDISDNLLLLIASVSTTNRYEYLKFATCSFILHATSSPPAFTYAGNASVMLMILQGMNILAKSRTRSSKALGSASNRFFILGTLMKGHSKINPSIEALNRYAYHRAKMHPKL